jgi:phosphoglucan, water dikinase
MLEAPRIRIGTQSAFSADFICRPFEYAAANGFEAFEWLPDKKESGAGWEEKDIDAETRRYIKETSVKHDIRLSVHAPCNLNPATSDYKNRFLETIDFAEMIHASLLNVHLYTEQGIDAYVRGILPVAAVLAQKGLTLSVENTPLTGPQDFNLFFKRLKDLAPDDTAHVGMCLDIGHANLCRATHNDYLRFIDLLEPHVPVIHVHLHENYGDFDSHLTVFTGPAQKDEKGIRGFVERMKKRAFSGAIILEQWPNPPSLLNQARDRLHTMFGNTRSIPVQDDQNPKDGFLAEIGRANRQFRSWRQRLAWIRDKLNEQGPKIETDQLAYLAIYLRLLGTGEIACVEDGKHYRPSRHATIARDIFDRLARATTPENAVVVRRIYPWLPSFSRTFTRAEPLTRIRDIAHRDDIPMALKKEIKHTLQNKLHRCAGPEDLATSAALLKKITLPDADYATEFVKAFKAFHEQLKEFFNARSLDEQLHAMMRRQTVGKHPAKGRPSAHKKTQHLSTVGLIERFLEAKHAQGDLKDRVETFERLTALRAHLHEKLERQEGVHAQRLRTAELGLEDFSFSLMSQIVNRFQAGENEIPWPSAIRVLELAVRNMALSRFHVSECLAIGSESAAWRQEFDPENTEHLLRLKATLDRCRRLTHVYSAHILSLFIKKAHDLGMVLGLSAQAVDRYCEADIRSHLVFQLSRLLDILCKALRQRANISAWDVIVSGNASGRLAENIDDRADNGSPVILLQERIQEDEDMPKTVAGVVAARAIAHLSHPAIRLRHRGIPCVVCEDQDLFAPLKNLINRRVSLKASEEQVVIKPINNVHQYQGAGGSIRTVPKVYPGPTTLYSRPSLLSLDDVEIATGGAKAYGAKKLMALSQKQGAAFKALQGVVIPFGAMEAALKSDPSLERAYRETVSRLEGLQQPEHPAALKTLRQIIAEVQVPDTILKNIEKAFPTHQPLIVRSSSNCEDLEKTAGAGLYDSFPAVSAAETAQVIRLVWASLWNKRAVMARAGMGIAHDQAHMAVLIQPLLSPEYAFVIHTVNPLNKDKEELYMELAVGLGESLASGKIPGSPYRTICNTHTREIRILAFAGFSWAFQAGLSGNLVKEILDYSKIPLSTDHDFRSGLIRRLAAIGRFVETALQAPQDIEGAVREDTVYLVQTRPQLHTA